LGTNFLCFLKKIKKNKGNRAIIIHEAEIGRAKNIEKFPSDIIRDWRKEFSSMGPRINAIIKGAGSYLNFLNR